MARIIHRRGAENAEYLHLLLLVLCVLRASAVNKIAFDFVSTLSNFLGSIQSRKCKRKTNQLDLVILSEAKNLVVGHCAEV